MRCCLLNDILCIIFGITIFFQQIYFSFSLGCVFSIKILLRFYLKKKKNSINKINLIKRWMLNELYTRLITGDLMRYLVDLNARY